MAARVVALEIYIIDMLVSELKVYVCVVTPGYGDESFTIMSNGQHV